MFQVVKRDGELDEFKMGKITAAIDKAFDAKGKNYSSDMIDLLGLRVTADFQNKRLLPQRRKRMDECVRNSKVLVGRERENRPDSPATDNGALLGFLSVRVGIGTAERQLCLSAYRRLLCLSELHGSPEIKAQRAERDIRRHCPAKTDESPAFGQPCRNDTQKRTEARP